MVLAKVIAILLISLFTGRVSLAVPSAPVGVPGGALQRLVDLEADRLITFRGHELSEESEPAVEEPEDFTLQLDDFAKSISKALSAGKNAAQLQDDLAKAINIADIINKAKAHQERRERMRTRGVLDIFEVSRENIVHNKHLSREALTDLVAFAEARPKERERVLLLQLFAHANALEDNSTERNSNQKWQEKIHEFKGLIVNAAHIAVDLADELYLSPVFLEHLPVIGMGITRLKLAGQTTYDVIRAIRSFKRFLEHYDQLPERSTFGRMKFLVKSGKGLKMFNKSGLESLQRLADKLFKRYHCGDSQCGNNSDAKTHSETEKKEIVSRCAHFILTSALQAVANLT